ncbi:hypothetical protein [Aurantimonas marina]|uniref:hypothetical protein n=1 Tax=Aurantimonas marina TaxID=2780508 RepID=UPI0019D1488E|nr:hypothetical protein [Aurantimonas marina]
MSLARHALFAAALLAASPATADNLLVISDGSDARNAVSYQIDGDGNRLEVLQTASAGGSLTNAINLKIEGDGNGGPSGGAFSGAPLATGLLPGRLTQHGEGNAMDVSITGSSNIFGMAQLGDGNDMTVAVTGRSNLFALAQNGDGNAVTASIRGAGNQAAVQQFGNNNTAVFSQAGNANSVSITQRSY